VCSAQSAASPSCSSLTGVFVSCFTARSCCVGLLSVPMQPWEAAQTATRLGASCRGHAGGFLSGLLLAFCFAPSMVPSKARTKEAWHQGPRKPASPSLLRCSGPAVHQDRASVAARGHKVVAALYHAAMLKSVLCARAQAAPGQQPHWP
jgi:hypothetical protein